VSEGAVSAKRFCLMFGAKPAQSENARRSRGQAESNPEEGAVGYEEEKLPRSTVLPQVRCIF
jgi:hypothetical protein